MKCFLLLCFCIFLFAGCSSTTIVTFDTLDVTENPVGTKVGKVDRLQGGILEAAKNGGITNISTVSIQNTNRYTTHYWPLFIGANAFTVNTRSLQEIIVTGE